MKQTFLIKCIPPKATSQQKGVMIIKGQPRFFKKKNVKQAEDSMFSMLIPHVPKVPFEGPLKLSVVWTYPFRKSEKKSNLAKLWMPCDTRPDCSNLIKMFEDCMTRLGFFTDDSQIADLRFIKGWGVRPGIAVTVETWDHETEKESAK